MKYATRIFALTLAMVPILAAAQLGSNDKLVTQVPFEFVVANHMVPAGECIVQTMSSDGKTIVIRNVAAKVGLFSTAIRTEGKTAADNYALVFHKYGDRYFLSGMKLAGDRTVYRLWESKAEAELRAQNAVATEEVLLASRK